MSEELDAGPILRQEKVMLNHTETFGSLHQLLSELEQKIYCKHSIILIQIRHCYKMISSLVMPQKLKNWIKIRLQSASLFLRGQN